VGDTWYVNFNSATNTCTIDDDYATANGYMVGGAENERLVGTYAQNDHFALPESFTVNGAEVTDIVGGYAFVTYVMSGDYIAVLLANLGGTLYRMEFNGTMTGNESGTSRLLSASVSAVPIPAALPLFAAGLSAMGFMGWRKRRKTS
jgi:hypothetical protein